MSETAAAGRRRATPDHSRLLRRFAANLRRIREKKGLTQDELAARAGIGLELLKEIEEAGGHMPNVSVVLRLAGSLAVRPSAFAAGVGWTPYEFRVGEPGRFEVLEDPDLVAEIAVLREALPRRGGRGAGS
ncbi:MAG TPA: helix-turn-helix transcriptional regulator [Solirubrobacterales bacterium]|jgi:transcriptional regulator with XRE-family HTH domain|nr:helix-turn-helix transcriptional regulator [Solirubrobacterales bacterium]